RLARSIVQPPTRTRWSSGAGCPTWSALTSEALGELPGEALAVTGGTDGDGDGLGVGSTMGGAVGTVRAVSGASARIAAAASATVAMPATSARSTARRPITAGAYQYERSGACRADRC